MRIKYKTIQTRDGILYQGKTLIRGKYYRATALTKEKVRAELEGIEKAKGFNYSL